MRDYRALGERLWTRFTSSKDETLWYYRSLVDVFEARAVGSLSEELSRVVAELHRLAGRPISAKK